MITEENCVAPVNTFAYQKVVSVMKEDQLKPTKETRLVGFSNQNLKKIGLWSARKTVDVGLKLQSAVIHLREQSFLKLLSDGNKIHMVRLLVKIY
jgi:hypothetical protein